MKKLGKNLSLVERTVEAYECISCPCSCTCSCGTSSTLNATSGSGVQYQGAYDVGTAITKWNA